MNKTTQIDEQNQSSRSVLSDNIATIMLGLIKAAIIFFGLYWIAQLLFQSNIQLVNGIGIVVLIVSVYWSMDILGYMVLKVYRHTYLKQTLKKLDQQGKTLKRINTDSKPIEIILGQTLEWESSLKPYNDYYRKFIGAFDEVYDLDKLSKENKTKQILDEMAEESNELYRISLYDTIPGTLGAVMQNAHVYGLAHAHANNIKQAFMQGKNSGGITRYMATLSDDDYVAYMEKEHPMVTAIVKAQQVSRWKLMLTVMGYLTKSAS